MFVKIIPLSMAFSSLIIIYFGVVFFLSTLLGFIEHIKRWIYSLHQILKALAVMSYMFGLPHYFSIFNMCYTTWCCSTGYWDSVDIFNLFFFCLCSPWGNSFYLMFQVQYFFLYSVSTVINSNLLVTYSEIILDHFRCYSFHF